MSIDLLTHSSIYCSFYLLSFSALISTNRVNATLCFLAELYIIKQVYNLYILNEKRRKISPQLNVQLTLVLYTLKHLKSSQHRAISAYKRVC